MLPPSAMAVLLILALIWGSENAMVKIGSRELPPLYMAGLRSAIAALGLFVWMKAGRINLFPSRRILAHGLLIGALFGLEFGLTFLGLQRAPASRVYVLKNTAPFFVAVQAHLFLHQDRLSPQKVIGLIVAFAGVAVLFSRDLGAAPASLTGDILVLIAAGLWGTTTVYIKRFLAGMVQPLQILFYQVFFSAPLLLLMSLALEPPVTAVPSPLTIFALVYQGFLVAFLSYLVWFHLVDRHPVSLLHAFSFFTPIAGVVISGLLILGEEPPPSLYAALALVSAGVFLINRPRVRGHAVADGND